MCLAIPMRVVAVDGIIARCAARGVERDVCLLLVEDQVIAVGDQLLVHVGYAIQKIDDDEATAIWDTFDVALALADEALAEQTPADDAPTAELPAGNSGQDGRPAGVVGHA